MNSRLRQLVKRKQMVAVRDKEGQLCTGTNGVGRALGDFWQEVMVSPPEGAKECTEYLITCNPRVTGKLHYHSSGRNQTLTPPARIHPPPPPAVVGGGG